MNEANVDFFFKLLLYALKFDMDRLLACPNDIGDGFRDSKMTHKTNIINRSLVDPLVSSLLNPN